MTGTGETAGMLHSHAAPRTHTFATLQSAPQLALIVAQILSLGKREEIQLVGTHRQTFKNMRVLVTGAGGSIGSAIVADLCRDRKAASVSVLDQDDSALQSLLRRNGSALINAELCNIRDWGAVKQTFANTKPTIVIHCAALKHIDFLEQSPREAVLTNVRGLANVLRAARRYGATVVNLSSDKAADPRSVLGYCKRISERLTSWYAASTRCHAVSIRLGNVIGSRGSVIDVFVEQLSHGLPLTITDESMTRFYMSMSEAVVLIKLATITAQNGVCLVPKLGRAIPIAAVAMAVMKARGSQVGYVLTGTRPGEKTHEVLVGAEELTSALPGIPGCSVIRIPPLSLGSLKGLYRLDEPNAIRIELKRLAYVAADAYRV